MGAVKKIHFQDQMCVYSNIKCIYIHMSSFVYTYVWAHSGCSADPVRSPRVKCGRSPLWYVPLALSSPRHTHSLLSFQLCFSPCCETHLSSVPVCVLCVCVCVFAYRPFPVAPSRPSHSPWTAHVWSRTRCEVGILSCTISFKDTFFFSWCS